MRASLRPLVLSRSLLASLSVAGLLTVAVTGIAAAGCSSSDDSPAALAGTGGAASAGTGGSGTGGSGTGGSSAAGSGGSAAGSAGAGGDSAGSAGMAGHGPIMRVPDADLAGKRTSCGFATGAWPAETIGSEYPLGADIPIKHVVVIMQENRSFDHYLGRLVAQGYYQPGDFSPGGSGFDHPDQMDGPPAGWSNPDGNGGTVTPHPDDEYCFGVNHSWVDMHDDYDDGKNDHFVTNNNPDGQRSFFYVDDTIIPFYYGLADKFAIGDRYFASVMSSTWPNRLFMMGATSYGVADNSFVNADTADHPVSHIFSRLTDAGRTWRDYTDGPHQELFFPYFGFQKSSTTNYKTMSCDLLKDIQNGTLPDFALVMGNEVGQTSDEGPSALPGIGGSAVEGLIRAPFASPSWKDTVVFITYDENGGMADHVPPAPACEPDGLPPVIKDGTMLDGKFDHTGFRVPFIAISPYAKSHFVSHRVYDHSSVVRFVEALYDLPALTARDANTLPPFEMFDFQNPPNLTPPTITKTTTVDQAILDKCKQKMSPVGCQ